jgi:hypothetical protein
VIRGENDVFRRHKEFACDIANRLTKSCVLETML